jgi:hypothetical protein
MMDKTQWFANCGWGVFCHYLSDASTSQTEWNEQVDAFDVVGLACQLKSVHAPYFCIAIGQNSGHFLAPNMIYDSFTGIQPSKCSRRDLVADLYDVLHPLGIELLVYLPSGAPAADSVAMEKLEWEWGFEGGWPQAWNTRRTGKRLAAFQMKWEEIIREWSLRWGPKVRGWWIDGCYFADEMYRHTDAPNFASFTAAMKAGNPDSIVAFNPGVTVPVICHTEYEDYTAGEISEAFPTCPGPWVERHGNKARYHILSYLGSNWCLGNTPRFNDEFVVGYTQHVNEKGGVVTWDVPILENGLIPEVFVKQLQCIGEHCASAARQKELS